jgi:hypothetical protein
MIIGTSAHHFGTRIRPYTYRESLNSILVGEASHAILDDVLQTLPIFSRFMAMYLA